MHDAALLVFALLMLGGAILLLLFLRYRHSPAVLWYGRIVRRRAELTARRAEVLSAPANAAVAPLADELFTRYLRTVPMSALATQPGIGPATVDKLESAGWKAIPDVKLNQLDGLPGLGRAKAAEVRTAVRQVTTDARSRFDAGACPEGVEFRRRAAELATVAQAEDAERVRQVAAIDAALTRLNELAQIAEGVSFWNSLFYQKVPGLTDTLLHAELPGSAPLSPGGDGLGVRGTGRTETPSSPPAPTPTPSPRPVEAVPQPVPAARGEEPEPSAPPFLPRLRAICRFGLLVAKADGRLAKAERAVLRGHLGTVYASDNVALRFLDVEIDEADKLTLNEADVTAALKDLPAAERTELLALAQRIASAAGQVSAKEQQLLARLHAALGEPAPPPPPVPTDPRHNPDLDAVFGAPPEAPPAPPPTTDLRHNPDLDAVFGV